MAGRIRTIKPELREHVPFAELSDAGARLLLMLYTIADDEGRCPATPGFLNGAVFFAKPRPISTITRLTTELQRAGFVAIYFADRAPFLEIVGWREKGSVTHQRIEKPQPARYPAPESFHSGNLAHEFPDHSGNVPGRTSDLRPPTSDNDHRPTTTGRSESLPKLPDSAERDASERESAISAALAIFHQEYKRAYDGDCVVAPDDRKAFASLVDALGAAELARRIVSLFREDRAWLKGTKTIRTLCRNVDSLVPESKRRLRESLEFDDDAGTLPELLRPFVRSKEQREDDDRPFGTRRGDDPLFATLDAAPKGAE